LLGQIYLVRHGQTAWNKARIYRGRRDVQLNEQGRQEAERAGQALRDVPLVCVYTSPLSRAKETAQRIAALHDAELRIEPEFTDLDYGQWTEYWDMEIHRKFPKELAVWENTPQLMNFPRGETLDIVRARAMSRLKAIARLHRDDAVAIVTHRAVLKVMFCAIKGLDTSHFWDMRIDTAAISVAESNGARLRFTVENDTRHIQSMIGHDSVDF